MKELISVFMILSALWSPLSSAADNKVDILFVIDNSGSMSVVQNRVIYSARNFFKTINADKQVDWKIGLISTDQVDRPYFGFDENVSSTVIGPDVNVVADDFSRAINRLGTAGDYTELTYFNIERVLTDYPYFHRKDADIAVVMVTDEKEQSEETKGSDYKWDTFFKRFQSRYISKGNQVRFYGVLNFIGLDDCVFSGHDLEYSQTSFSKIIDATRGFTISSCNDRVEGNIEYIAHDIQKMVLFE